jgi:HK97 family phage major capsid protein
MLEKLYREASFDRAGIDAKNRTIAVSFSSELPVDRGSYVEILDHSPENADLSFLNDSAPVLDDHDTAKQCGVVESAQIVAKKGRASLRFSKGTLGTEIFNDFADGIRKNISVGYTCTKELSREEMPDGRTAVRFAWKAFEISPVSIPADSTVGFGRSKDSTPRQMTTTNPAEDSRKNEITATADYMTKTFPRGKSQIDQAAAEAILRGTSETDFKRTMMDKIDSFKEPQFDTNQTPDFTSPQAGISDGPDIGSQFSRSRTYQSIANVRGSKKHAVTEVAFSRALNTRATGTTSGFTSIDKVPGVVLLGQQQPTVADLLTEVPTMATTVRFMLERSFTNAATAVAEEGLKPEATWDLVETDSIVRKIAVIGRVTDEMFQDYAQMRAYINDRLAFMVAQKEDNFLLNGLGNSNQILGLLQTPLIQTQVQGASTAPDAIHKAMTKIRTGAFLEPDGIVLNPLDWENIRLMKDENGQYYGTGPLGTTYGQAFATAAPVLWQKPVVLTTAIAQGTVLVGAFKNAAAIYRKLGLTIETTNSDASDFQYNRIAVRAETRLTLACYRPLAFCTVTGLS